MLRDRFKRVMLILSLTWMSLGLVSSCSQLTSVFSAQSDDKKVQEISTDQGLNSEKGLSSLKGGTEDTEDKDSNLFLNLNVKKFTLENGLKVLILENHRLPILSYYTFYEVGARYEYKGIYGGTHFLEHMMFKGAKKFGPGAFFSLVQGMGGSFNAYTNFDSTVYNESVPSKYLEQILDLEADRMVNLMLEPASFEKERAVILEERANRYEVSPAGKLFLKMNQALFEGTPYGKTVIGSVEEIKEINRDNMFKYFRKYYAPNNAIVVIVGDVDTQKTIKLVREKLGKIPPFPGLEKAKKERERSDLYADRGRYKREIKINAPSPAPIFLLAYRGGAMGTRRANVHDILASVLGGGDSSYFTQRYVKNKRPLLEGVWVNTNHFKYGGSFYIGGRLLPRTSLKGLKRRLIKETTRICDKAITKRNIQKIKNQLMIGFYKNFQTNASTAHVLGLNEHLMGDYQYYQKDLEIYNSIDADEVRRECKNLFKEKNYVFLSVWDRHPKGKSR